MIEPIEVVWTLLSLAGLVLHLAGIRAARYDMRALRLRSINGARLLIVRGHLIHHAVRALVKVAFIIVGVIGMNLPPMPPSHPPQVAGGIIIIMLIANVALVGASLVDALHRRALIDWYRAQALEERE